MDNTDRVNESSVVAATESQSDPEPKTATKKEFIKPQISVPVDVLEATTFFQAATSGVISP